MNLNNMKQINKLLNDKFYIVLNKDIENNLKIIKTKRKESLGLLKQIYITLNNAEMSLKSYNFVDSSSLLRNALEYLSMVVKIEENDEAYEEFKIISDDNKLERKHTSPERIIKYFAIKLGDLAPSLFGDMSNRQKIMMIDTDLYGILSRYTHASLAVSLYDNMYSNSEKKIIRLIMNNSIDIIKYIFLKTLSYYNKRESAISDDLLLSYNILYFYKISINLTNSIDKEKLINLLYYDSTNKGYYEKLIRRSEGLKKEIKNHPLTSKQIDKLKEIMTKSFE